MKTKKCITPKSLAVLIAVGMLAVAHLVSAGDLLVDTQFSKESGWSFWVNQPVVMSGGSVTLQGGVAIAKSPAMENQNTMDIQLIKSIDIEANKSYTVKFTANADTAGKLTVSYCLSKAPYTSYASTDIVVGPGENEYECTLNVKEDRHWGYDAPRSLRLFLGAFKDATITVSNVSFREVE